MTGLSEPGAGTLDPAAYFGFGTQVAILPESSQNGTSSRSPFAMKLYHPYAQSNSRFALLLRAGVLVLAGLECSCSVALSEGDGAGQADPSCRSQEDCDEGVCYAGSCYLLSSNITTVLLEISPTPGTEEIGGLQFLEEIHNDSPDAANSRLTLPFVSRRTGKVLGQAFPIDSCLLVDDEAAFPPSDDGSLPATVNWIPRERLNGLTSPVRTVETVWDDVNRNYLLSANITPGVYDIYVVPHPVMGECERPPVLFLEQDILPESGTTELRLAAPELLSVKVIYPKGNDDLKGFKVDLIDRSAGRLLSSTATLEHSEVSADTQTYLTKVAVLPDPVDESDVYSQARGDLVRLSPPPQVTAPILYFERSVLELFHDGTAVIDQLTDVPIPVVYSGALIAEGEPVAGSVTFQALELDGVDKGTVFEFVRTVEAGEGGTFELDLLPGKYRVTVIPVDRRWAQTELSELEISGGAGLSIELLHTVILEGEVLSADNKAMAGVAVQARDAVPASSYGVLDVALGEVPFFARSTASSTNKDGIFQLNSDPGELLLIVQPDESSGLPWSLHTVDADVDGELSITDFTLRLGAPFRMNVQLDSSDIGVVPSATIRAYVYVQSGMPVDSIMGVEGDSSPVQLLPIYETRVDSAGAFSLILPAKLFVEPLLPTWFEL